MVNPKIQTCCPTAPILATQLIQILPADKFEKLKKLLKNEQSPYQGSGNGKVGRFHGDTLEVTAILFFLSLSVSLSHS